MTAQEKEPVYGIVAEYDPFHLGHQHLLCSVRQAHPNARIVIVLGGNLTQRGEIAMFGKYARAKMAVLGGADLVLELPYPYCAASAELFAEAGVQLLHATGVCTGIAFGSECGSLDTLLDVRQRLQAPAYLTALAQAQKQPENRGIGYPALRQIIYEEMYHSPLPSGPNDILALAYLCANAAAEKPLAAFVVQREGSYHASGLSSDVLPGAGAIRANLFAGKTDAALQAIPPQLHEVLLSSPRADMRSGEAAVLWQLSNMSGKELDACWDIPDGMGARIAAAAAQSVSFAELCSRVRAKQYTAARVRRMIWSAFFGVTPKVADCGVQYSCVLGCSPEGKALLRRMTGAFPILVKRSSGKGLTGAAGDQFRLNTAVDRFYQMLRGQPSDDAMRYSPFVREKALVCVRSSALFHSSIENNSEGETP